MASDPRRVVLTGSESTGKTTLAEALARHYGTAWVPEYARDYAAARGGILTAADVEPIARGQLASERAGSDRARERGLLVLDTDLLSTAVYAAHYYGAVPGWIEAAVAGYPATLYLLCDIDLPWEPDGVRDRPAAREEIHGAFARALERGGRPVALVSGIGPVRTERAIAAVDRWLAGGTG